MSKSNCRRTRRLALAVRIPALFLGFCLTFPALAKEAVIADADLVFVITDSWSADAAEHKTPDGLPIQRWLHTPVVDRGQRHYPRITAWTVPIEADTELVDLTNATLSQMPFETNLGAAQCLKCVTAILPRPGSVWIPQTGPTKAFTAAVSYKDWPDCEVGTLADYHGTCMIARVNSVNLTVEPSWAFRLQTNLGGKQMDVVFINLIANQRLVVISFWYPVVLRQRLTDEIFATIESIRLQSATLP